MLSIAAMSAGQGRYYQSLAQEDYYLEGGEPPGRWWGEGAAHLGLNDVVTAPHLKHLFRGYDQHGEKLIQNAGHMTGDGAHQPGWDLTFSAPKSVSVFWSQADFETRRLLQDAHDKAVKTALEYLQSEHAFTRRGKAGVTREAAKLVVALYEHGTSRALDPQMHTHALVMNVGVRADGTTGTILSKPFYEAKMTAGALYRAEFASLLQHLGLAVERDGSSFRIVGVPQELVDLDSKRRDEIVAELGAKGLESAAAAAAATLSTREVKTFIPPRKELFERWREEAKGFEFNVQKPSAMEQQQVAESAVGESLKELTAQQSHFNRLQLIRAIAQAATPAGWSAATILLTAKAALGTHEVITLNEKEGIFSTPQILKDEKRLMSIAGTLANRTGLNVDKHTVDKVLEKYKQPRSVVIEELKHHAKQLANAARKKPTSKVDRSKLKVQAAQTLTKEQRAAVRFLTGKRRGTIRVLEGIAGSGKTTTLRAAREAWEKQGYQVIGAALSGRAARELERGSAIRSLTLRGLLWILDNDNPLSKAKRNVGEAPKGLLRQAIPRWFKKLKTELGPKTRIDNKTVLVIDEAGMLDTKHALRLLRHAKRKGAEVIWVGDRAQCPPIGPGAPFPVFADRFGKAELTRISRQLDERDRDIVKLVSDPSEGAEKRVAKALTDLAKRKLVHVAKSRDKAVGELVKDWHDNERGRYADSLIFVSTNEEARHVSQKCQAARLAAGELDTKTQLTLNGFTHYVGDRVLITKRSKLLKVENGDIATLVTVKQLFGGKVVVLKLDNGMRVSLPLAEFDADLKPGYAITTHKGQGSTTQRSYVLAGGPMTNQQLSYVQLSRHRESVRVYTSEQEAGPNLTLLVKQMSRSGEKRLATTLVQQPSVLERL